MDPNMIGNVLREEVSVILRLSAPMLLLSMVVGILMALIQAVTQIHEQSLNFVMKLVVVLGVLIIGGSWMMRNITEFTLYVYSLM